MVLVTQTDILNWSLAETRGSNDVLFDPQSQDDDNDDGTVDWVHASSRHHQAVFFLSCSGYAAWDERTFWLDDPICFNQNWRILGASPSMI